jgi:hypothetical protein
MLINVKEIAKRIVTNEFNVTEDYFSKLWDYLLAGHDEKLITKESSALSACGAQSRPVIQITKLFVKIVLNGSMEIPKELLPNLINEASEECDIWPEDKEFVNEKVKKLVVHLKPDNKHFEISNEPREHHAMMWTKETGSIGKKISKEQFEKLINDKKKYEVFIIDEGEFERGQVGAVHLSGERWSKLEDRMNRKEEGKYLTPLFYRILVHTLKNHYMAGDTFILVEKCWKESPRRIKELKSLDKISRGEKQGKYRKGLNCMNEILREKIDTDITAVEGGVYHMTRKIVYCVIEVVNCKAA